MLFNRHLLVGSLDTGTCIGLESVIIFLGSIDFRLFFLEGVLLMVALFSFLSIGLTLTSTLSSLVSVTDSDSSYCS